MPAIPRKHTRTKERCLAFCHLRNNRPHPRRGIRRPRFRPFLLQHRISYGGASERLRISSQNPRKASQTAKLILLASSGAHSLLRKRLPPCLRLVRQGFSLRSNKRSTPPAETARVPF